jgi:predicted  nucleic acid-binding Zn-ribbon protein
MWDALFVRSYTRTKLDNPAPPYSFQAQAAELSLFEASLVRAREENEAHSVEIRALQASLEKVEQRAATAEEQGHSLAQQRETSLPGRKVLCEALITAFCPQWPRR